MAPVANSDILVTNTLVVKGAVLIIITFLLL